MSLQHFANFIVGKPLRNGAILHAVTFRPDDSIVVLARRDDACPWVTWRADQAGNCYWGHYFSIYAEAVADYNERAALPEWRPAYSA